MAAWDDGRTAELFLREGMVAPDDLIDALNLFDGSRRQAERRRVVVSYVGNP